MAVSKKILLTQESLKELFHYDEKNGNLYNRVTRSSKAVAGKIAGHLNKIGYVEVTVDYKRYRVHRLIYIYVHGVDPGNFEIDHKNQIRYDNRIENLRLVSASENRKNTRKSIKNTSGFTGVCWDKPANKWKAYIYINGKRKHLGYFDNLEDAIACRKSANLKYEFHKNHGK